ncbi:MAG TPA: hypothetical protein VHI71_02595 [Actinomycetota bacterium]|nr:hypothetical protein [Actinomycetota bacterium]
MRTSALRILAVLLTLGFVALPAAPALAVRDEPTVLVTAWYWEDQTRQRIKDPTTGTDVAVISAPNPFCPSAPLAGSPPPEACKPGRLPVQVREGDYETPNQLSAVGFDLALVPLGSKISKFTVTFVEAKDQQSEPVNAEGKSLQACFVDEFFGDGEASLYAEVPKYTCSEGDPIAPRKEIKVKEEGGGGNDPEPPEQEEPTFGYTFDLTEFARTWKKEGTPMTAIMLMPVRPKEADYEPATDANWRTVLVGAVEEGGIKTSLSYTPPATPPVPPDPAPPTDTTSPTDTGSPFTPTDTGSVTPPDTGSLDPGSPTSPSDPGTPTDLATGETDPASATVPKGWPSYVWLGILAGIVGLSMVRSVVLERAAGIRPDGVLAQIRRLNASRRGVELAAAAEGPAAAGGIAAIVAGLKTLGEKTGGIAGKLRFGKKGSS